VELDVETRRIVVEDWTERGAGRVALSFGENAIANLFLAGEDLEGAARRASLPAAELAAALPRLLEHGLLLTEDDWARRRAQRPYVNLPSMWDTRGASRYASYEEAYRHGAAPWNDLPPAVDLVGLIPLAGVETGPVVDLGCGTGHNLALLRSIGIEPWGIDVSPSAVNQIRSGSLFPERFEAGSVTKLPWPDASFSLALDVGCLHCLAPEERDPYVEEIRRVLRPGGRLLCRAFKPRERRVVEAQPVRMDALGFHPDEGLALFGARLPAIVVKEGPVHVFYEAMRPGPSPSRS
jgi:SAM-dependent methyltransferase